MTNSEPPTVAISQQEYQEFLFYKRFISRMNAAMYVMDLSPYRLSWISDNDTVKRTLGMDGQEVMDKGDYIMASLLENPDFSESVTVVLDKFKDDPDINWAGVYRIKDAEGNPRWALYSASTLEKNEEGVATKASVVAFPLVDVFNTPETLRELQGYIKEKINIKEVESLTLRQKKILTLLGNGKSRNEIAEALGISIYTVDDHKKAIYKKFDCSTSAGIVKLAQRLGLV